MTKEEFDSLKVGDIISSKVTGLGYNVVKVIAEKPDKEYIARRELTATNPDEWEIAYQRRKR